ncbi:unnamed protein product [Adineta ricciae]|uniref:Uncharacterized protein n=1 Tax=Adineta ricciae TaxID=249248 RepID=A0A815U8D1_ADIRI|nr:unnamed protein product [Adineta ricciae]CAF1660759.1 unnamed protein product [Adineta ricciae]
MPKSSKVSREDLQNFVQKIKYFNLAMNYQDDTVQYDSDDDDNAEDRRINQRLDPLKSESDPVQVFSISAQFSPIPTGSDRFLAAGTDCAIITQIRSDPASDLLTWSRSISPFHRTHQSTGEQLLS